MDLLKAALRNTWKNFDFYLTFLGAAFVFTLKWLGIVGLESVLSSILAILALLALSILRNRNKQALIDKTLVNLKDNYVTADNFFDLYDEPNKLRIFLPDAKSAFFWGVTLHRTIPACAGAIKRSLERGAKLRFLLAKPYSSALNTAVFIREPESSQARENNDLYKSIEQLVAIVKSVDKINNIEVRTIDYFPPYAIFAIDADSEKGIMTIVPFTFKTFTENRPSMNLLKQRDQHWFEFFEEQFEKVWLEAAPFTLSQFENEWQQYVPKD